MTTQTHVALLTGIALIVLGVVLTPIADQPLAVLPGYIPAFCAAMFTVNMMLTGLLYSRATTEHNTATAALGWAYLYVTAMFVPFLLSFPGAMAPGPIIGREGTVVWIWSFWHGGFGLAVIRYAYICANPALTAEKINVRSAVVFALAIAAVLTYVSSEWQDVLPSLLSANDRTLFQGTGQAVPLAILMVDIVALISLLRLRGRTAEQTWLAVGMVAACFDVWLTLRGVNRYSLGWYVSKIGSVTTSMVILVSLFIDHTDLYRQIAKANRQLRTLADQDGLTKLGNRRRFDEVLDSEWARAMRTQTCMSLLMTDVDHFKKFNDHYGHLGGDDCLRNVGRVIGACALRPTDLAARYGGEEFAVILPGTGAAGAEELARRIRAQVEALNIAHAESSFGLVTLSIGVATLIPEKSSPASTLVKAADEALYDAKNGGRNRVYVSASSSVIPTTSAPAAV